MYIGQTSHSIEARAAEHYCHIWVCRPKSAMAEHGTDLGYHFLLNNNSILAQKSLPSQGKRQP
jgi:hypothetical protein